MSAPFFLTVSAAFLLVAMMFFRGQRALLIRDIAFGVLLVVSILLYVAYAVADSFTDAGINQAVWFHLRYGLRGAGFGAYTTLIAAATTGLTGALALCFAVSFWRRTPAGAQPAWGIMPFGLLLVSGAFNPAIHDLGTSAPRPRQPGRTFTSITGHRTSNRRGRRSGILSLFTPKGWNEPTSTRRASRD